MATLLLIICLIVIACIIAYLSSDREARNNREHRFYEELTGWMNEKGSYRKEIESLKNQVIELENRLKLQEGRFEEGIRLTSLMKKHVSFYNLTKKK